MIIQRINCSDLPYTHVAVEDTGDHIVTYLGIVMGGHFYRSEASRQVIARDSSIMIERRLTEDGKRMVTSTARSRLNGRGA